MSTWWMLLLVTSATVAAEMDCVRAPQHAQPADTHYKLSVAGDPDLFLPGELYTVSLQGIDSGEGSSPFTGFMIWTEPAVMTAETSSAAPIQDQPENANLSLGTFQTYDAQSKLYEKCKPAVVNATTHSKTDIQVIWTAPITVTDLCIRLCARAGPDVKGEVSWSILARKLCATASAPATSNRQPPIVEPCCACDEAKYEVTFEGLWSRFTHPREFPPEAARAHFGDVIGATHTAQYRVWQEGRVASPGLRRLAEDGTTTALEKELKEESDHIRTIIKARGISWQHLGGRSAFASTFAVFRVDARHHLMSLAAKLAPSPDWIVGVSALELCNANCTWRNTAELPLFPYDAGTDGGLSYTSRREPTKPPAAVRALRPDWPRDVRSPFYNLKGEMRPFARLRLSRLRLYEKNCDSPEGNLEVGAEVIGGAKQEEGGTGACLTHQWGAWSPCSVTCGSGRSSRQRQYAWPSRAYAEACRVPLTDHRHCYGPRMHCKVVSDYEPDPAESSGPCAVSPWSDWSACSGCGVRARTRHYIAPRATKRCHTGFRARTVMHQTIPCPLGPCQRSSDPAFADATNYDWFYVDRPRGPCRVTEWSWWSPCSARCGHGRRMRTRLYVDPDTPVRVALTRRLMFQWAKIFAKWQGVDIPEQNLTTTDPEVETLAKKHLEECQFTLTLQESLCDAEKTVCTDTANPQICGLPLSVGPCRGYEERWFHDSDNNTCEPFSFTGCGGNENNFRTQEECYKICANYTKESPNAAVASQNTSLTTNTTNVETPQKKKNILVKPKNEAMQSDAPVKEEIFCKLSAWRRWKECIGDCTYGIQLSYRFVDHPTSSDGRSCSPALIRSRECKPRHCYSSEYTNFDRNLTLDVTNG